MRQTNWIVGSTAILALLSASACHLDPTVDSIHSQSDCDDDGFGCSSSNVVAADECTPVSVTDPAVIKPIVQLLIDHSDSMQQSFAGVSDNSFERWNAVVDALDGTDGLLDTFGDKTNFRASLYTGKENFGDGTTPGHCLRLSGTALGTEGEIGVAVGDAEVSTALTLQPDADSDTPTAESINAIVDVMPSAAEYQQRLLLLVTDGSPDTCEHPGANSPADPFFEQARLQSELAAVQAYLQGIEVYTLLIADADNDDDVLEEHIQRLANSGVGKATNLEQGNPNAAPFFKGSDASTISSQFGDMLRTAYKCRFQLDGTVTEPDSGTVTLGDSDLVYETDWMILEGANGSVLELIGDSCQSYLDNAGQLQADFPCDAPPALCEDYDSCDACMNDDSCSADDCAAVCDECAGYATCEACADDPSCPEACLARPELACMMCADGSYGPDCENVCADGSAPPCDDANLVYAGGGCSSTGGSTGLLFGFALMLALALVRRRYAQRAAGAAALALALAAIVSTPGSALAQGQVDDFAADRLRLAMDRDGLFNIEGAQVAPKASWDVALWGAAATDVVVLYTADDERERLGTPLRTQLAGNLTASYSLLDSLQIGVDIPLILSQESDDSAMTTVDYPGLGFGDIRLLAKWQFLNQQDHGVNMAAIPAVTLPTGNSEFYRGDRGPVFVPSLAASRGYGRLVLSGNLGIQARTRLEMDSPILDVRNELFIRFGPGYRLDDILGVPLGVGLTFSAATAMGAPFQDFHQNQLEGLVGATYDVNGLFQIALAGGRGFTQGLGTPEWRAIVGVRLGQKELTRQPSLPVYAGEPAECDDLTADADGDNIPDAIDECPQQAETVNGFVDKDGCPDEKPEPVAVPECPGPESFDRDLDTVPDCVDKCINTPGQPALDGCQPIEDVQENFSDLFTLRGVNFENNSAIIKKDDGSYDILDNAVKVLRDNPNVTLVEVAGHTDCNGNAKYNRGLSQRRSEAVMTYLVSEGIAAERLTAKGYGEDRPLPDSEPIACKKKSGEMLGKDRRVEFVILEPSIGTP